MAMVTLVLLMALTMQASIGMSGMHGQHVGVKNVIKAIPPLNSESVSVLIHTCTEDMEKKSVKCDFSNLSKIPDYLSSDLQILSVRFNLITKLLNSSFSKYSQLTYLDVEGNDIQIIESGTFTPLTLLQYLSINENHHLNHLNLDFLVWSQHLCDLWIQECQLTSFLKNLTHQHIRMQRLMLGFNELSRIKIACFQEGNKEVEIISLVGNNFLQISSDTFLLDCDVDVLDLTENPLSYIDPDTVASFRVQSLRFGGDNISSEVWNDLLTGIAKSHIKELVIVDSRPEMFTPNFFHPLNNFRLSKLNISNVHIKTYKSLFSSLNLLSQLTIQHDNMKILEPTYFSGMNTIQILHVEHNQIKYINTNETKWTTGNLREIYLCYNDLAMIPLKAFEGLTSLSLLDLSHNENLLHVFSGPSNLQYLNMSGTILVDCNVQAPVLQFTANDVRGRFLIPGITFRDMQSLEYLDLDNSSVETNILWNSKVNKSLFEDLNKLSHLSLKLNPISELVSGIFRGLSALEFLDLSQCKITGIEQNVFRGLISLKILTLADNNIQRLPGNMLIDQAKLRTCNLTNTNLNYLDIQVFASTTSMETLLLSANQFTDFNHSTFKPIMPTTNSIDISKNPLVCGCSFTWLVKWLKGGVDVLNDENTVCTASSATLEPLRNKPLMNFIPNKLCGSNIALICSIPLAAVGLVFTICYVYHHRWFVKYKLYLLKLAVLGYEEVLDAREHGDFDFDLNIMFVEDDAQWVQEHLKPVLEEKLPHFNRNAFGDEDLTLGMHYLDAVYYVIEKSFKTVFLFSRAAFQDNWFMTNFRIAFEHVKDDQLENVVVVFLDDVADAELPFLVRLYLSNRRTYIWWEEEERGQEYFWNKLILTLQRDNRRWNNMIPDD